MATQRTVYLVLPESDRDRWLVTREHNGWLFRRTYRTKAEAVSEGRSRAERHEPSQLKVLRSDGNLEFQTTYGGEPRRCAATTDGRG
jgi:hypothetical protein